MGSVSPAVCPAQRCRRRRCSRTARSTPEGQANRHGDATTRPCPARQWRGGERTTQRVIEACTPRHRRQGHRAVICGGVFFGPGRQVIQAIRARRVSCLGGVAWLHAFVSDAGLRVGMRTIGWVSAHRRRDIRRTTHDIGTAAQLPAWLNSHSAQPLPSMACGSDVSLAADTPARHITLAHPHAPAWTLSNTATSTCFVPHTHTTVTTPHHFTHHKDPLHNA